MPIHSTDKAPPLDIFWSKGSPVTQLRRVASREEAEAAALTGNLWVNGVRISNREVSGSLFAAAPHKYAVPALLGDHLPVVRFQAAEIDRLREENASLRKDNDRLRAQNDQDQI